MSFHKIEVQNSNNSHPDINELSESDSQIKRHLDDLPNENQIGLDRPNSKTFDKESYYFNDGVKLERLKALEAQFGVNSERLTRKIDLFILPPFCLIFFVSWMNKSVFGFMLIDGLGGLTIMDNIGWMYTAFFLPYAVLQIFSNFFLSFVRPHFWISIIVLLYGAVGIGCGFAHSFGVVVFCEVLHGLLQAGTETAIYYLLAHYYERSESQTRFGLIYSMASVGGIISSFINYESQIHLDGKHGLDTWRWLNIIEGSITMFTALILFFTFPDFPEGARFFKDNEAFFLIKKLELYGGKSGYNLKSNLKQVVMTIIDPLIIFPMLISFFTCFALYGMTVFEPFAINLTLGFEGIEAERRNAWVWVASFVWTLLISYASDFFNVRSPFIVINLIICAICCTVFSQAFVSSDLFYNEKDYVMTLFMFISSYSAVPLIICWTSMNVLGHLRKSICITLEISAGSVGGIACWWLFCKNDADFTSDHFRRGLRIAFAFLYFSLILVLLYAIYLHYLNRKKGTSEYKQSWDTFSKDDKIIMGDKNPYFEYQY